MGAVHVRWQLEHTQLVLLNCKTHCNNRKVPCYFKDIIHKEKIQRDSSDSVEARRARRLSGQSHRSALLGLQPSRRDKPSSHSRLSRNQPTYRPTKAPGTSTRWVLWELRIGTEGSKQRELGEPYVEKRSDLWLPFSIAH